MSKAFKETTQLEKWLPRILGGVILIVFTIMAFFVKQPCDIDRVYLWCRLHPMSLGDIIGLIMFYGGCIVLTGILPITLYNPENSSKWNLITFAVLVLSMVLIWNT